MKMLVIEPDGSHDTREVPDGYPAMNDALFDGGLIQELVGYSPDGDIAFLFDEEGKFKNLVPNLYATRMFMMLGKAQMLPGDVLVGRVAVCGLTGDGFTDVPDSVPWVREVEA